MAITDLSSWLEARCTAVSQTVERILPRLRGLVEGAELSIPDDLQVLGNGLQYEADSDRLRCMWFHVCEREGGQAYQTFRAVRLMHLSLIPLDARGDSGSLAKMRTVLRGLYSANTELVYLVAGIYHPRRLGIVQCYGAVGQGETLEEAAQRADESAAALEAAMTAAYPQIRFESLGQEVAEWLDDALQEMPYSLLAVGHPDPRENARGGMSDLAPLLNAGHHPQQPYTLQQNELVMRGMSELEEDFLLQAILAPFSMQAAARMLVGLAEYTSTWAAWQTGSRSFNFGASVPMMLAGALASSVGSGYTQSAAETVSEGVSQMDSQSHTIGLADAHSEGQAHAEGVTNTHTESQGITETNMTSAGSSASVSDGRSQSNAVSDGVSQGRAVSDGVNSFASTSNALGASLNVSPAGLGASGSYSYTDTSGGGTSHGVTESTGASHVETAAQGLSHEESHGVSESASQGTSISRSSSDSFSRSSSDTSMSSDTHTDSQSDTTGSAQGTSRTEAASLGAATARGLSRGFSNGITVGLAPSVSMGESNQWQFDPAILLTTILRRQQDILNTITLEGGFYTDVYALARTPRGKAALLALIPEAFHGVEDVVMGVQVRDLAPAEDRYIRRHAMAMTPSTREVRIPEAMTAYADSTLLTVLQASAYLAPGLFEEGLARTVQEKIPAFALDPDMDAGIPLGLQYSTERGRLTASLLRLTPERHFHTAFIGDTGSGKSVTAERLAYESTREWHYRTIVLDFGQGWRKALRWPGMDGRVDIRQLYPGAVRPMRWNPLQVPRRIDPARYRNLVIELFANAGRMGPRQLGFMREALTTLYVNCGVLIPDEGDDRFENELYADKSLREDERQHRLKERELWQFVRGTEEEAVINQARQEKGLPAEAWVGRPIQALQAFERQALAIQRSRRASIAEWVNILRALLKKHERDQASRSSLQGVLLRVEPLAEGEMRRMYGPGHDTVAIEDLGLLGPADDRWGMVVIEGGAEMDEFSKSALLSLIASILYLDAVVRRREALSGAHFPLMQIFFEEANKVLSGIDTGAASDSDARGGNQTAQIFLDMWRDGRKFRIFLHVLAQTVSELPQGILSSCNNAFFGQTKDDRDRAAILAHLARSTKGFVNADYDRFIARMAVAMSIAKLGYTQEITQMEPYLIRPLMLPVSEPADQEIYAYYHSLGLVN